MITKITGCENCPMYHGWWDEWGKLNECKHPSHETKTTEDINWDDKLNPITPDWCPLKKEPLILQMDNQDTTEENEETEDEGGFPIEAEYVKNLYSDMIKKYGDESYEQMREILKGNQ